MDDVGQFDRRITLQQPVQTRDAAGGVVTTWATVATVWARRYGTKGREYHAAGRDLATIEEAFQVRHSQTVAAADATWRLLFGGRVYALAAALEQGRRETIVLLATTGANHG